MPRSYIASGILLLQILVIGQTRAGIDLSSFTATILSGSSVRLDWTTGSEFNNYGFFIQRSPQGQSNYQDIPGAFIPGNGTTSTPHQYDFIDTAAGTGLWYYRLKQMDLASGGWGGGIHYSYGVAVTILEAPTIVHPAHNATGVSPNTYLSWNAVSGALGYRVQLSLDETFLTIVVDDSSLTDTSRSVGPLDWGTVYYWRVRSGNASHSSIYSPPASFTTVSFTVEVPIQTGWNMISNPASTTMDSIGQLFPQALTPYGFAFEPLTGYVQQWVAGRGKGYWLKFPGPTVAAVGGSEVLADSFAVQAGWNIVGSISVPVAVESITSEPSGLILTPFYSYDGALGTADSLNPGRGYWVKTSGPGILIIQAPTPR